MKIVIFYHSLVSDWNHGNAHFLRGVVNALQKKGHTVSVYEPENGWSLRNLLQEKGSDRLLEFKKYYPTLQPLFYDPEKPLDAKTIFTGADLVIVHEWNSPDRKSTRLNSSHVAISYAVFCLKKKKKHTTHRCGRYVILLM